MKKNKTARKKGVTLVEVFTHVMGTQEMTVKLMGKMDAMAGDAKAHFDIIEGRLNKIENKQIEHDQRFEQVDRRFEQVDQQFEQVGQQFEQVDQQLREIKQTVQKIDLSMENHGQRLTALEGNR